MPRSRDSSRRPRPRPVARGARSPLARGGRRRAGGRAARRRRRAGRHTAGRRSTPSRSTPQALELMPEDDPRRRSIRLQQVVTAQAFQHLVAARRGTADGDERALDGVVDQREVVGRDVARDLVDLLDEVIAEQLPRAREPSPRSERRRRSTTSACRRRRARRGCAPRRSPGTGGARSPSTASRRSGSSSMSTVYVRSIRKRGMGRSYLAR